MSAFIKILLSKSFYKSFFVFSRNKD